VLALVDRVAWAVPRAAAIAPFRADCLRQAEAARSWLAADGIGSHIRLGVRRGPAGGIDAHAWLVCGNRIVTGGEAADYTTFRRPSPPRQHG
jgi:hypothetical protein